METPEIGKTSQIWLKGSEAFMRWFFWRNHTAVYCKTLMETLFGIYVSQELWLLPFTPFDGNNRKLQGASVESITSCVAQNCNGNTATENFAFPIFCTTDQPQAATSPQVAAILSSEVPCSFIHTLPSKVWMIMIHWLQLIAFEAFVCDTHIAHVDIAIKHQFSMLCAALIKGSTLKWEIQKWLALKMNSQAFCAISVLK